MSALLEADGLAKAFGPTPALAGASIEVQAGEVVAIVGASGSGKSTLLHCLAGIVRLDAGRILYRGADLTPIAEPGRVLMAAAADVTWGTAETTRACWGHRHLS